MRSGSHAVLPGKVNTAVEESWQCVFGKTVEPGQDFFSLGGSSLKAYELIECLNGKLGIRLPVSAVFEQPTIEALSSLLENTVEVPAEKTDPPPESPISIEQERWPHYQSAGAAPGVIFAGLILDGKLQVHLLERALRTIISRHETLHTRYRFEDGRVDLVTLSPIQTFTIDFSGIIERQVALEQFVEEQWFCSVDLERDPLFRLFLCRLTQDRHMLCAFIHPMAGDRFSLDLLFHELGTHYRNLRTGKAIPEAKQVFHFKDYVRLQRRALGSGRMQRQRDYWRRILEGASAVMRLPLDYPRPNRWRARGKREHKPTPADLHRDIAAFARQQRKTPYQVYLAAFQVLLFRYTGSTDFCLATSMQGRIFQGSHQMIGPMTSLLPIRAAIRGSASFSELLASVSEQVVKALEHRDFPCELLIGKLRPEPDPSLPDRCQIRFTHAAPNDPLDFGAVKAHPWRPTQERVEHDLHLIIRENAQDSGVLEMVYNSDLFDRQTMDRMLGHYLNLLRVICANPAISLFEIAIFQPEETRRLLHEWNDTAKSWGEPTLINHLIWDQVQRTPEAEALIFRDDRLSYRELYRRARTLAGQIREHGQRGSFVGVCAERSTEMTIALLATLDAGRAYVPIDPVLPRERMAAMITDTKPAVILVQAHLEKMYADIPVNLIRLTSEMHEVHADDAFPEDLHPLSPVYAIFTSGSTGTPKAAVNTHRAVSNRIRWMQDTYPIGPGDRVLQKTPFSFDVSVWEFFTPLTTGATLVVAEPGRHGDPTYLAELIEQQSITSIHFVPSMLEAFITALGSGRCRSLKRVFSSGEAMSPRLRDRFFTKLDASLHNLYGPTETAVEVSYHDCSPGDPERAVPIGRPIANTRLYIVDASLRSAPVGVAGELLIGGDNVGQGYHDRPRLTAEKFVPDPFSGDASARLYRTGDLTRFQSDGEIIFTGRVDHQIKLRGFRIELGEIENTLTRHAKVNDAVVKLVAGTTGQSRLDAWLTSTEPVTAEEINTWLRSSLPEYMIPSVLHHIETMPQLPNGKKNRNALSVDDPELARLANPYVEPGDPVEEQICAMWADLLGKPRVGARDHFFESGGDSLTATRMIHQLCRDFDIYLPLDTVFEAPTVRALALLVRHAGSDRKREMPEVIADPDNHHEPFPLNDIQQAYFLGRTDAFELGNVACHMFLEFSCKHLDMDRLARAWCKLIARHGMLRAVVDNNGNQHIQDQVPDYVIEVDDLSTLTPQQAEDHIARTRNNLSHEVFDPSQWPLFRLHALKVGPTTHLLYLSLDLLIMDGFSFVIIFDEWRRFYEDDALSLPSFQISFRDYVLGEYRFRESQTYQRARDYWQKRLPDLPPAPGLPLAVSPSTIRQPRFQRVCHELPDEKWSRLVRRAREESITPSCLLAAAYARVLAAWSQAPRFTLNLTLFNRLPVHEDVESIVGDFTTLELLEIDPESTPDFLGNAKQVQKQLWLDLEHREYTGIQVMRDLAVQRGMGAGARMPIVFTSMLQDYARWDWLGEVTWSITQTPQVWLDHVAMEHQGNLRFHWDFVANLFPENMIEDMFTAYVAFLERLADEESAWREPPASLLPDWQTTLREAVNNTQNTIPEGLLHQGFLHQTSLRPCHPAIVTIDESINYRDLAVLSHRIAHELIARGLTPGENVAVVMEKGWEQVAAVLAILQAGGVYVPINANFPRDRIHYLLDSAEVSLVLTQPWAEKRQVWPDNIIRLSVTHDAFIDQPENNPNVTRTPEDLAYIIFTSGSTGKPKGVMINHRGAVNTNADINSRFEVSPEDRVFAISALNFDLSVYDIFGTLAAGATLVIPNAEATRDPAHWVELLERERVTIWNSVPALMQMLVEYCEPRIESIPSTLRLVLMSGDWIPTDLPARIRKDLSDTLLISMGGATEASIWSIIYTIDEVGSDWKSIPYGKPMVNQTFHVLDHDYRPSPVWVPGDLYIGGIGLAMGYWRDEEKTDAAFIQHPRTGHKLYRTGDLGRYLPDGNIEFLGREDHQVKIKGHRIELGEIETNLSKHPEVRDTIVTVWGDSPRDRHLVAYVVPCNQTPPKTEVEGEGPEDFDEAGIVLKDPIQRMAFKMGENNIRTDLEQATVFPLDTPEDEVDFLHRRTFRRFLHRRISKRQFSALMGCLRQIRFDGSPVPKYQYASAGGLYPVQIYLLIKDGGVEGFDEGIYYYDPRAHQLRLVKAGPGLDSQIQHPGNRPIFDAAAFTLWLLADMDAVEPMYGEESLSYASLEAGLISHLLEERAPRHQLGMCQIGGFRFDRIKHLFPLTERHVYLHHLIGGVIDPTWLDEPPLVMEVSNQETGNQDLAGRLQDHLTRLLPDYMVPASYTFLDSFPLSANGKVDRKALPKPELETEEATHGFTAPEGDLEEKLAEAFANVLGRDKVSVEAGLEQLGANSIQMVRVHGFITTQLGYCASIVDLYRAGTIRGLAEFLRNHQVEAPAKQQQEKAENRAVSRRQRLEDRRKTRLDRRRR